MKPPTFSREHVLQKGLPYWQYFVPSEMNAKSFFTILKMDEVRSIHPETENEFHSHNFYTISWFIQGTGSYIVNFQTLTIEPNTIFFTAPKQIVKTENLQNEKGFAFAFSEDFLLHLDREAFYQIKYGLFFNNNGVMRCKVKESTQNELEAIISAMKKEISEGKELISHTSYLAALFSLFLFTIERKCLDDNVLLNTKDFSYKTFLEFRDKIEHNCHKLHLVKDYVKMLNVSLPSLAASTQKYAGTTPLKMINMRITLEAKRLLYYTPLRVKEISALLGFDDPSYFVKFFKRNVGMTPAEFKEIKRC